MEKSLNLKSVLQVHSNRIQVQIDELKKLQKHLNELENINYKGDLEYDKYLAIRAIAGYVKLKEDFDLIILRKNEFHHE